MDEIFVHAIKWPNHNRLDGIIDSSSFLADVIKLLENETTYIAGLSVWRQLVLSSSYNANRIPVRYEFMRKSLRYLSVAQPMYYPDHQLLRRGLNACEALFDSDLAADLLCRAVTNYSPNHENIATSPLLLKPHVPFQELVCGINICLRLNDMASCENILNVSKKLTITPTNSRTLHVLVLKGYAHSGDIESTLRVLTEMNDANLHPRYDATFCLRSKEKSCYNQDQVAKNSFFCCFTLPFLFLQMLNRYYEK
jgi:hypothetical protein